MKPKAAFLFLAAGTEDGQTRTTLETDGIDLTVVGVPDYEKACEVCRELEIEGITLIELCGGFGIKGTAAIKAAVSEKTFVGVVRFDIHPGIDFKSGDVFF